MALNWSAAAEHLALAAGQIEHAGALLDTSHFTDLHQLGVGEGVKDSMVDLGDFVQRQRHVANRPPSIDAVHLNTDTVLQVEG